MIRILCFLSLAFLSMGATVQEPLDREPLSGAVVDADGKRMDLAEAFDGKPSLLMLGYVECPHLCSWSLSTICNSVTELKEEVGSDFSVVFLSLNPDEELAALRSERDRLYRRYGRGSSEGWLFLKAEDPVVRSVASQLGVAYESTGDGDYAHPAAFFVIDPEGRASEAFYGMELPAARLAAALDAAREGTRRPWGDTFLMLCRKYNPLNGRYGKLIEGALRAGGGLTVLALGTGIFWMTRSRKDRDRG